MPNDRLVIARWRRIRQRRDRLAIRRMMKQAREMRSAAPMAGGGRALRESRHPWLRSNPCEEKITKPR